MLERTLDSPEGTVLIW